MIILLLLLLLYKAPATRLLAGDCIIYIGLRLSIYNYTYIDLLKLVFIKLVDFVDEIR